MINLSYATESISNIAGKAAGYITNMCINSKVDSLFHVTITAAQTHPYITIGLGLTAIYCCRGQIAGLINKVNTATQFLYAKIKTSIPNVTSIFRRDPIVTQEHQLRVTPPHSPSMSRSSSTSTLASHAT